MGVKYKRKYSVIFKITSRCNDSCDFCIEKENIEQGEKDLSLSEIKNNFQYLKRKYSPDLYIITGGEPTLHPDFFKIIDYFHKKKANFRIITNLIKFNEADFVSRLFPYFLYGRREIIGSINELPRENKLEKLRIRGFEKILELKIPVMLITVIYNNNLANLAKLVRYLARLLKKHNFLGQLCIEFRMIYIEGTSKVLLKKSLPTDFLKIKELVQLAVDVAESLGIAIILWNFPLCYLDRIPQNVNKKLKQRCQRILLKVNKDFQLEKVDKRDFLKYFLKIRECSTCPYKDICSGIDRAYIFRYNFPNLGFSSFTQ